MTAEAWMRKIIEGLDVDPDVVERMLAQPPAGPRVASAAPAPDHPDEISREFHRRQKSGEVLPGSAASQGRKLVKGHPEGFVSQRPRSRLDAALRSYTSPFDLDPIYDSLDASVIPGGVGVVAVRPGTTLVVMEPEADGNPNVITRTVRTQIDPEMERERIRKVIAEILE